MSRATTLCAAALCVLLNDRGASAGEPAADDEAPHEGVSWLRLGIEASALMAGGAIWYWSQTSLQREDWELRWDLESWRLKLTNLASIRFDTNRFSYNANNHPVAGAIYYQLGRANGLGPLGGMLVNLTLTAFWEYVVEFKEIISLNDLVFNLTSGIGVGEPLLRASALAGDGPPGARASAALLSPFDGLHAALGDRRRAPPTPWYHLAMSGGGAAFWPGEAPRRFEAIASVDLELEAVPGAGQPGRATTRVPLGAWSQVGGELAFGSDDPYSTRVGARFRSRSAYAGVYRRDLERQLDGLHGAELLAAISTGFTYDTRRIALERDKLASAHLIGGELMLARHRGPLALRWRSGGFVDFALVQAHVFGPVPPFERGEPYHSSLQARGYYFGGGLTAESRLSLRAGRLSVDADARVHAIRSLDGLDRHEVGGPDDPHEVTDQRLYGRLATGVRLGGGPARLELFADGALRRGAWRELERTSSDVRVGLALTFEP